MKKNFPTAAVNLGCMTPNEEDLTSTDYYRKLGLSTLASETLSKTNGRGYPIEEFYWLDQKWWQYYSNKNESIICEIKELTGGAFKELPLADQCELLKVPFYPNLEAESDNSTRSRKKWLLNGNVTNAENYVAGLLRREFEMVIADEGEHIKAWIIMFYNLYYKEREKAGLDVFTNDFGTDEYNRSLRTEVINLANSYTDDEFYLLTKAQIELQIQDSWWSSNYVVDDTIAASKSWGKAKILNFAKLNLWGAGMPDIMAHNNDGHHTLLEVKTSDRLHQSQATFIRNSKSPMELDIRVVRMTASKTACQVSEDDFLSWVTAAAL